MTVLVIFDPLTSYFLGVTGFGEPLPEPGAALALGALGMALVIAGVAVLARSPLLRPAAAQTVAGGPPGSGHRPLWRSRTAAQGRWRSDSVSRM